MAKRAIEYLDDDESVSVKKVRQTQFDIKRTSVSTFICSPEDKTVDALHFIATVEGVKSAVLGDNTGEVIVLFAGETWFRRKITCFDGPDWTMKKRDNISREAIVKFLENNNQHKIGCVCINTVPPSPSPPPTTTDNTKTLLGPKRELVTLQLNYTE